MEPKDQKQHKIPQVYLKQFGFEEDKKWIISVWKVGSEKTENVQIVDFLKEVNVFDLSFGPLSIQRHFDIHSRILENRYRTIISNLENQKRIADKDWDYLNHFVANLLCRSGKFRSVISTFLSDTSTKEVLLREINTFFDDSSEEYLELFSVINTSDQLQITIGTLMDHMVKVFRSFKKVVLQTPDGTSWITSDNPVYIDRQEDWTWIVPVEAELYLPLSKKYCLFMFHDRSEKPKSIGLRVLVENKVHLVSFGIAENINAEMIKDSEEYVIFGTRMEEINISSFWSDEIPELNHEGNELNNPTQEVD